MPPLQYQARIVVIVTWLDQLPGETRETPPRPAAMRSTVQAGDTVDHRDGRSRPPKLDRPAPARSFSIVLVASRRGKSLEHRWFGTGGFRIRMTIARGALRRRLRLGQRIRRRDSLFKLPKTRMPANRGQDNVDLEALRVSQAVLDRALKDSNRSVAEALLPGLELLLPPSWPSVLIKVPGAQRERAPELVKILDIVAIQSDKRTGGRGELAGSAFSDQHAGPDPQQTRSLPSRTRFQDVDVTD